jgi:hypothetical protein
LLLYRYFYVRRGIPIDIPHQHEFIGMSDELKESLKLKRWSVEKCGLFIFVKKIADSLSLKDNLGKIYEQLLESTQAIGKQVARDEIVINANWKVIV